ncbi:hypothetical protein [Psychroflexus aestuariivivens]|uniref:hypothetical protein n=1 Tax=Psychroflexus aestuariivivens TaxID=1795040 RepID=UPI000FDCB293|nr:hypothetical protein [Psychroflexus aestuariivivens]
MKKITLLTFLFTALILTSCKQNSDEKDDKNEVTEEEAVGVLDTIITIEPLAMESPKFPDAKLTHPGEQTIKVKDGKVDFDFEVENYELGVQSENAGKNGLANSDKGQHIHFILDNGPYSAHYEPEFSKTILEGDHVLLAFLSRSYHESVKNPNSFVVKKIRAGEPTEDLKMDVDFAAEHLFYSRPKGTYKGEDTEKILLDFFLVNTEIGEDGNKVKVKVNNQEFLIDQWIPHVIENMPMGENKIELTLVDEKLIPIEGPFNNVTRTITLEE